MKKFIAACLAVAFLMAVPVTSQAEKSTATATVLSAVMPGAGEWYNSGWQGGYPWAECIVGALCFCVRLSSVLDAANGNDTQGQIRIDFWSAPQ